MMVRRIGSLLPSGDSWSGQATFASPTARAPRRASMEAATSNTAATSLDVPPCSVVSPKTKSPRRVGVSAEGSIPSEPIEKSKINGLPVASSLTKSPQQAHTLTGGPIVSIPIKALKGSAVPIAPPLTKSPKQSSLKGPACFMSTPLPKSPKQPSVSRESPATEILYNNLNGPESVAEAQPLTKSPRQNRAHSSMVSPAIAIHKTLQHRVLPTEPPLTISPRQKRASTSTANPAVSVHKTLQENVPSIESPLRESPSQKLASTSSASPGANLRKTIKGNVSPMALLLTKSPKQASSKGPSCFTAPPLTKSPRKASTTTGSLSAGAMLNNSNIPAPYPEPPPLMKSPSPRQASVSTGRPVMGVSITNLNAEAPPLTKSPKASMRSSISEESPTTKLSSNSVKGHVFSVPHSLTKSPRRASISTDSPTTGVPSNSSKGSMLPLTSPLMISERRASISPVSPTTEVSSKSPMGPQLTVALPLMKSPRQGSISIKSPTVGVSPKTSDALMADPTRAPRIVGSKIPNREQSSSPQKLALTNSIQSPVRVSKATEANTVTSLPTDELAKVMMAAKPSEIRAAARAVRAAVKAERERQERMLQEEQAAQMKMNKIRAEIDAIKEREKNVGYWVEEIPTASVRNRAENAKDAMESSSRGIDGSPFGPSEDGPNQVSNIERLLECMGDEQTSDESELKEMGKCLLVEMEKSFVQLSSNSDHLKGNVLQRNYHQDELPVSTVAVASGNEPARHRELRSTNEGRPEKVPSARPPPRQRSGLSSRRPPRTPSNLVPEMRRRANQRDLMFDDEVLHPASEIHSISSHSPNTASGLAASTPGAEATTLKPSSAKCLNVNLANDTLTTQSSLIAEGKKSEKIDQDQEKAVSSQLSLEVPLSPPKADFSLEDSGPSSAQLLTSPRPSIFRNSTTMTPLTPISDSGRLKIMEEEKRKLEAQRKKLDEAREYFQEGHDLCWKLQDSARALGEYRKALFIRESLLGKYHDETGRSYYWIGKSLVKLKEYEEALVAFSRALRIFERVLTKAHKYRKWTDAAIAAVFREMDDPDADYALYMKSLDDSIAHERAGDSYRKKQAFALAISEYRAAIENIEEYHPGTSEI